MRAHTITTKSPFILVLAVAIIAVWAAPASATFPGEDGRISFQGEGSRRDLHRQARRERHPEADLHRDQLLGVRPTGHRTERGSPSRAAASTSTGRSWSRPT